MNESSPSHPRRPCGIPDRALLKAVILLMGTVPLAAFPTEGRAGDFGFSPGAPHILQAPRGMDAGRTDGLRYGTRFGETEFAAAIAYGDAPSGGGFDFTGVNGSASLLFGSGGISLTGMAGSRSRDSGPDAAFIYGKIGYIFNATSLGGTAVSIGYQQAEDPDQAGEEFTSYGAFLVQNFDRLGTEFYVGFRNHELERTTSEYDETLDVLTGARIKF